MNYAQKQQALKRELVNVGIGTECLICGDTVPIYHPSDSPKICDKCKAAVLQVRNSMEDTE